MSTSLYQQLFRNRTVLDPLDAVFTDPGTGLAGSIGAHLPALSAALNLSSADLAQARHG